jgi:hypothetical protein
MPLCIERRLPRVNQQDLHAGQSQPSACRKNRLRGPDKDLDASAIVAVTCEKEKPTVE